MKHNLLVSYCTYLSFYLLLRLDSGDQVADHQVLFKIVTLRKTLEGLSGLDEKLAKLLASKKPSKKQPKDSLEPSEQDDQESNLDDYEIDPEEGEVELENDDDEDMEDM